MEDSLVVSHYLWIMLNHMIVTPRDKQTRFANVEALVDEEEVYSLLLSPSEDQHLENDMSESICLMCALSLWTGA